MVTVNYRLIYTIVDINISVIMSLENVKFLGAASGSPYIVFISTSGM